MENKKGIRKGRRMSDYNFFWIPWAISFIVICYAAIVGLSSFGVAYLLVYCSFVMVFVLAGMQIRALVRNDESGVED